MSTEKPSQILIHKQLLRFLPFLVCCKCNSSSARKFQGAPSCASLRLLTPYPQGSINSLRSKQSSVQTGHPTIRTVSEGEDCSAQETAELEAILPKVETTTRGNSICWFHLQIWTKRNTELVLPHQNRLFLQTSLSQKTTVGLENRRGQKACTLNW